CDCGETTWAVGTAPAVAASGEAGRGAWTLAGGAAGRTGRGAMPGGQRSASGLGTRTAPPHCRHLALRPAASSGASSGAWQVEHLNLIVTELAPGAMRRLKSARRTGPG